MKVNIEYPQELFNLSLECSFVTYLIDAPLFLPSVMNICKAGQFHLAECNLVFGELVAAFDTKTKVSRLILESKLKANKLPTQWLYEATALHSSEELKLVAIEIVQYHKKRELYALSVHMQQSLLSQNTADILAADYLSGLTDLNKVNNSAELLTVFDNLKVEMTTIQEGRKLKTGFDLMDLMLPPFIGGHTWIIGAGTGTGKTFFALQLFKNIVEQEGHVALFSTELQSFENLGRVLGNEFERGYQSMWQIPNGTSWLNEEEVSGYVEKIKDYGRIYDNKRTIQEISLECRSLKFQDKLEVVIIDFLQNIDIGNKDTYEGMRKVALELQRLAKDLKVTVILTSQLSNSVARNGSKVTSIEYKNAGEIAAAADVGIILTDDSDKYKEVMSRAEHTLPAGYKPLLCDVKKSRHTQATRLPFFSMFPSGRVIEAPAKFDWLNVERRDEWWQSSVDSAIEEQVKQPIVSATSNEEVVEEMFL